MLRLVWAFGWHAEVVVLLCGIRELACLTKIFSTGRLPHPMRLTPVNRQDLIRRLRDLGWSGPYSGAKHQHMIKGNVQLTIPNPHGGREIGVNLLKLILNEAGISRDEWLNVR